MGKNNYRAQQLNFAPSTTQATANTPVAGGGIRLDITEFNTCAVSVHGTGTFTIAFEGSDDGVNFYPIQMARMNSNTTESTYADVNGVQIWEASCHLLVSLQVRVTAFTSNASALINLSASPIAVEPAPNTAAATSAAPVNLVGSPTNNGMTTASLNSAATTNATLVKGSAAILQTICANNASAAAKFIRFYNKATAPVPGTDTPILVVTVPANSSKEILLTDLGTKFATGLGYAITNAAAVLDATAVAAGDVQLFLTYA